MLTADLAATGERAAELRKKLDIAEGRISHLEPALTRVERELLAIQNSTSWRMTAGLRWLMIRLRGMRHD
jgi:hypothetical protein